MIDHDAIRKRLLNPLTDADKANIDAHLETLQHVHQAHKRARMAGIDVSDSEKTAQEAEKKLRALRQTYFPHG